MSNESIQDDAKNRYDDLLDQYLNEDQDTHPPRNSLDTRSMASEQTEVLDERVYNQQTDGLNSRIRLARREVAANQQNMSFAQNLRTRNREEQDLQEAINRQELARHETRAAQTLRLVEARNLVARDEARARDRQLDDMQYAVVSDAKLMAMELKNENLVLANEKYSRQQLADARNYERDQRMMDKIDRQFKLNQANRQTAIANQRAQVELNLYERMQEMTLNREAAQNSYQDKQRAFEEMVDLKKLDNMQEQGHAEAMASIQRDTIAFEQREKRKGIDSLRDAVTQLNQGQEPSIQPPNVNPGAQ